MTLRCYVEDVARFLGRNGEVFVFDTPADLARFCKGNEEHDLMEIASWAEVADTDVPPLPADQDRYDLTELSEVLARGRRRRRGAGRPPGVRPAGRGCARPRRVRRAHPRRGAALPDLAAGPGGARAESEPDATLRGRGRRRAAPAVGRGRHPRQRCPGLPRLRGDFRHRKSRDERKRPAPGDPGTGRFVVQDAQLE